MMFVEKVQPLRKWFTERYGTEWLEALEQAIADAEADIAAHDARIMK